MTRIAIFAYGSLVLRRSAMQTLGREVEMVPVRLQGWRRCWSAVRDNRRAEKSFAIQPGGELPECILGLNLEREQAPRPLGAPNGALIEISEEELAALDRRELRYERVEVQIPLRRSCVEAIFTYTARPGDFAPSPPGGAAILSAYLKAVERGFSELGAGALETFQATTPAPPVGVVDAVLVNDRIPPGNPREW